MSRGDDNMSKIKVFLKKRWIWLLAIILIIAMILSTVEIYKEEVLNIDPDVSYTEKKTLYFAAERPDTLNPLVSKSEDVYYISKLIYDSLFEFDEYLNVVPCLVDSYSVDTEKAFVKITLRDGVKWHNGKKLKAADVKFTVDAIKQAGASSPYYDKCSRIMLVNVKSSKELTIYFNNNYKCSLDVLTFPIVPSSGYSSPYQFISETDRFKPVGTGKYCYASYDYLKKLKLKPNTEYFNAPVNNKIQVNILPDASLSTSLTEINDISCYIDRSTDRRTVAKDKKLVSYDIVSNQLEFVIFNTKRVYLSQSEVRQAIAYGIDTPKILENSYGSDAVYTDTVYYPNFLGVEDTGEWREYNYEKAVKLMKKAGLSDKNEDGMLEDANDKTIMLDILVKKSNTQRMSAAKVIAKNLETLGFDTKITALSSKKYEQAIRSRNFDLLIAGYEMEERYDLREFFNNRNAWGYYNAELYTKAGELERLYTAEEQKKKYRELKEALLDEMPYYALCYKKMGLVGISTFTAEKLPMFNNIYKNCETWSWKAIEN